MIIIINTYCVYFFDCYNTQQIRHDFFITTSGTYIMNKPLLKTTLALAILSSLSLAVQAQDTAKNQDKQTATLQTIVVTAAGYEQDVTQAPASMTVISREELDKREYTDITDVLRNTPGVVISGSGASQTISIRGMSSGYTLFLVNGKRQYAKDVNPNGDDNGFEKNILPPISAIERIEIIRGPASTLYGTDAMGGVINIITKKVTDEWAGNVELGTIVQDSSESGDIKNASIYAAGPLLKDKLGLQVSANRTEREKDSTFRGNKKDSLNTRLTYMINNDHDIELEANFTQQEAETVGSENISRNYRQVYALTHNGEYSDELSSSSYVQLEKSNNPDRAHRQLPNLKGLETEAWIANTQWNLKLEDHNLIGGLYFKQDQLVDRATNQNTDMPVTELDRWAFAVFAEDTWSITDTFNLTAGLRYDHDEYFEGNFSPRLYGVYTPNDAWTFKGGVSTGYKEPSLKQSSSLVQSITGQGSGFSIGNEALKPETSVSYEFGTAWQNDISKVSLTAYLTQFDDKITSKNICSSPNGKNKDPSTWECADPFGRIDANGDPVMWNFYRTNLNVDQADLMGVEATFETELTEYVHLNANYTYTDTEIKSGEAKGQALNNMPEHVFNVTVDYDINDALNLWSRLHYRSKTSEVVSSSGNYTNPGYEFLDVGFNYKFNPKLKAKVGVYNVLDEKAVNNSGTVLLDGRRYGMSLVANF